MPEETKLLKKQIHGTVACYTQTRCRCQECKTGWAIYNREKRLAAKERFKQGFKIQHGTPYAAKQYGCLCELCRQAARDYKAKFKGKEPKSHGTSTSYHLFSCRCEICRNFINRYMRNYREAKRASILAEAFPMSNV